MEQHDVEWEPIPGEWFVPFAGKHREYYIAYLGDSQASSFLFAVDPAARYTVDVIDTWEMTVTTVAIGATGRVRVPLPGRPGIAVRFVAR